MSKFYGMIVCFGEFLQSYLLLAMRLYWGTNFFLAGIGKVRDISRITDFIGSLGIPFPEVNGYLLAWTETIGGACLVLGLASRLVSIPLAFAMIVALLTAHHAETFAALEHPQRLISQLPFHFLLTCLIVLCFGPGKFSIDRLIEKRRE